MSAMIEIRAVEALERQISLLADALEQLGTTKQPWPAIVRDSARATATQLQGHAESEPGSTVPAILGAIANDLLRLTVVRDGVAIPD